jgi:transposase
MKRMKNDNHLIKLALQIGDDWEIDEMLTADDSLEVWLAPTSKRQWFGKKYHLCHRCGHKIELRHSNKSLRWQHIKLASLAVSLNVKTEFKGDCPNCKTPHNLLTWADVNSKITHGLQQQLEDAIPRIRSTEDTCKVIGVDSEAVKSVLKILNIKSEPKNPFAEKNECWHKLLLGEIEIKPESHSLKLLLQISKIQYEKANTAEDKYKSVKRLQDYFIKFEKRSSNELQQIMNQC